jgi:ABC-type arginine transport system permease subunit
VVELLLLGLLLSLLLLVEELKQNRVLKVVYEVYFTYHSVLPVGLSIGCRWEKSKDKRK